MNKDERIIIVGNRDCISREEVPITDFSHCGNKECPTCELLEKMRIEMRKSVNRLLGLEK